MANYLKYSTSTQSQALKVGNYWIGTGEIKKGPTSVTDYWNGITPPNGGYTIYGNKATQGPSIYVVTNDSELINTTNMLSGQSFTSVTQSLSWYNTQSDKMVFNREYEPIVTNGLLLNVDAAFDPSYPNTGTTWYNIGEGGANGTLVNGPTFNSEIGGSIVFDATDDTCRFPASTFNAGAPQNGTFYLRIKFPTLDVANQTVLFGDGGSSNNLIWLYRNTNFSTNRYSWLMYYNSGSVLLGATYSPNTWYDTAMTFTSQGLMSLYVNGAFVTSSTPAGFTSWSRSGTAQPYFRPASAVGSGSAQLLLWYNRALTANEILRNYNAQSSRLSSYDSDAQAFFTAAGITDTTQKTALNQLVLDLKSYGIWSKYSVIYPFVGGSSTTCSYNLKNPSIYQITFYGGWTFDSNGINSSVNSYGDTSFSPLSGFSSDTDYQYSIYLRSQSNSSNDFHTLDATSCDEYGYIAANHNLYLSTSNQLQFYDANGGYFTRYYSSTNPSGLFTISRTNSTSYIAYRNGTEMTSVVGPFTYSGSRPSGSVVITGVNDPCSGIFPTGAIKNYAFWAMGSGLTSTESSNLYTAVQAFQTTLGRQV